MGLFDNANIVAINNKRVKSIVTSDGGVLYEKTDMVSLSIDVPLNLVYSDAFSITGALTDVHDDGISGETVDLYVGDTLVDSTTTDSNGEYEFTQTPVSAGAHSFQVKYAGNTSYSSTTSSKVYRRVGKETTLLSVTSPVDNSTYYVGGAINVSGTLLTDDDEPLGNKPINYKLDGSTITSINTNNDGSISFQLGTISTGSHTLELSYAGDSNYTGSSVTRHITVLDHNYAISISCSTPIIGSGDSASIVATLTDKGVAVSGESVVFKDGSTVLDTVTTDSNGQASYTYTGTGAGDITFTVESMSLQETYEIEDCYKYVTDFTSWTGNAPSFSDFTLPTNHKVTIKLKNTSGIQLGCSDTSNNWIYAWNLNLGSITSMHYRTSNNSVVTEPTGVTVDANKEYSISIEGNTLKLYEDDTLVATKSTYDTLGITRRVRLYNNASTVDYLKVKAL